RPGVRGSRRRARWSCWRSGGRAEARRSLEDHSASRGSRVGRPERLPARVDPRRGRARGIAVTEHDDVMQAVADFLELFDEPAGAPIADACALARDLDGLAAARWPCSSSEYDADFEEEDGDSDRDRRALVAARYP